MIHPTALIHPSAQLGSHISVSPFAIIEAHAQIGDHSVIQSHALITSHTRLGSHNLVGHGSVIGSDPQDLSFNPSTTSFVDIGNHNQFREHCTVHRSSTEGHATTVGHHCFLMAGSHIAHDCLLGDHIVIANHALLAGHVTVGDRVFIGGGAVFHQFVRIGTLAICQGISGFGKDIPPYTTAAEVNGIAGLNSLGLRRAGFSTAHRAEIKEAFHLLYRSHLNTSQALAAAATRTWSPTAQAFWDFVASAKKRGICDLIASRHSTPPADPQSPPPQI
ncbi:MAG: acyl-ACP--UDP-N-acetylglucosamine O-acyltransferase [Verrucomicrobia bacterium]|nr:acyl-ACP--UDP-N-acetylglucosamine O-acyltransferase [Verrucomicrobiota bacterium]